MRVSIVSILLSGGVLALGACGTSGEPRPMTLAERTEQCRAVRADIAPTGRQTGDARDDYACRSAHAADRHDRGDRKIGSAAGRSVAIDRALKGAN